MGLDVSTLVLVAQDPGGKGVRDPEMLGYSRDWAKQVQMPRCTGAGCVKTFISFEAFLTTLKAYDHIGTLGILSHAGTDNLTFPGGPNTVNTRVPKTLDEIVTGLGTEAPVVDNVDILGCMVGRDVTGLWELAETFQASTATAYNFAHVFEPRNFPIDPGETANSIKERIGTDATSYLLENTDLDQIATRAGKNVQVWLEWYRMLFEDAFTPFDKADVSDLRSPGPRGFFKKTDASPRQVDSAQGALSLKNSKRIKGGPGEWPQLTKVTVTP